MRDRISTAGGLLLLLSFTATAVAQKIAWKIPTRGLVVYERTQDSNPTYMLVGNQFVAGFGICNPAVLFQTELDYTQQYVTGDPASLWELAMHIAFDLRTATGKTEFKRTYGFMTDLGTVVATGKASAINAANQQTITVKVQRGKLPAKKFPARVLEFMETNNNKTLDATLTIERTIDVENGRVSGFKSKMEAAIGTQIVRLNEAWRFKDVKQCRYPGFMTKVAHGIKIGAAHIKGQIADPSAGQLADGLNAMGRTVNTGLLALCLLTLIKSDLDAGDPVVKKGFETLRSREITDTYSAGIAIMALEALYTPKDERRMLIEGRIKKPIPRKPTDGDRALIRKWADRILHNSDTRAPFSGYERRFFYTAGAKHYDNSNSQYALLGLYSAHLCGVTYSPTIWHAMANHWMTDQLPEGKPLSLKLVSHTDYAKMLQAKASGRSSRRTVTGGKKFRPAGWPYSTLKLGKTQHLMPLTGSMTSAGITGLTICEAVLRSDRNLPKLNDAKGKRERPKRLFKRYEDARQRGYAWLLDNYSVRVNKHKQGFGFHFYYLYGLERACEIGQVALIGEHDWYFEGATMLLGLQRSDGKFDMATLYANCFAVLFLKQAAPPLPVITGKRR